MTKRFLIAAACAMCAAGAVRAEAGTAPAYVETDGKAFIKTDVRGCMDIIIEGKLWLPSRPSSMHALLGNARMYHGNGTIRLVPFAIAANTGVFTNDVRTGDGAYAAMPESPVVVPIQQWVDFKAEITLTTAKYTIGGVEYEAQFDPQGTMRKLNFPSPKGSDIHLFCAVDNRGNRLWPMPDGTRLASLKISKRRIMTPGAQYENVLDLQPYCDRFGAGFKDALTGKIYRNAGDGALAFGGGDAADACSVISGDGEAEVQLGGAAVRDDFRYRNGDVVTATVSVPEGRSFVRWAGDVDDAADPSQTTIQFTMSGDRRIVPLFEGDWIFDQTAKTIESADGTWLIKAYSNARSALTVARQVVAGGLASQNAIYRGYGDLDLSGKIVDAEGRRWTIDTIDDKAFNNGPMEGTDMPKGRVTSFISPKTLIRGEVGFNCASWGQSILTNVVIESDGITVFNEWTCANNSTVKRLLLRLKNLERIKCFNFADEGFADTDVSEWDLPSLREVENSELDRQHPKYTLGSRSYKGTLRLPSAERIGFASLAKASKLGAVELGSAGGTLTNLAQSAMAGCGSLTNVLLAASKPFLVEAGAFTNTPNLRLVRMPCAPPVFAEMAGGVYAFDQNEGKVCFQFPDTETWAGIKAQATPMDWNAKYEWMRQNPGMPEPYGVVPGEVFRSRFSQIVALMPNPELALTHKAATSVGTMDERFTPIYGERVEMSSSEELSDSTGRYRGTAQITVQAFVDGNPPDGTYPRSKFAGWVVNGRDWDLVKENPWTFSATSGVQSVKAYFEHGWLYEPRDEISGTIWNRIWRLNVTKTKQTGTEFRLGLPKELAGNGKGGTYTDENGGEGRLDMTGDINDASGTPYAIVKDSGETLGCGGRRMFETGYSMPTEIIFPRTIREQLGQTLNSINTDLKAAAGEEEEFLSYNTTPIAMTTNLVMDLPEYTGRLPSYFAHGMYSLNRVVLRLPKATRVETTSFVGSLGNTVADWWDLSSVTQFVDKAFESYQGQKLMTGTLRLPSIAKIGEKALEAMRALEGIELATGGKAKLEAIGSRAFGDATKLQRIAIGDAERNVQIAADAFPACAELKEIVLEGRTWDNAAEKLDAILAGVPEPASGEDRQAVVYASRHLGWGGLAAQPTAEETTHLAAGRFGDEYVMGVYREGLRKAWMVHRPSPKDPKPFIILIR